MVKLLAVLVCAVALSGCGSSGNSTEEEKSSAKGAYMALEKKLIAGDPAACDLMSGDYQNKLAASSQKFGADCPEVVKQSQKNFRADPELKTKSIDQVKVKGDKATLIAHSTYEGQDVRLRATLKRKPDGSWILTEDRVLDDAAPAAPLAAFSDYSKALRTGKAETVCALSSARGKELMTKVLPESHGGGACEGAVPFLAVAASKQPEPEVLGGEEKGDAATLFVLQSDGEGLWALRAVGMSRENGKWLFDASQELGRAPAPKAPSGPVT